MKKYLAVLISIIPINSIRIILYNLIFGYSISLSAKIGFGTVICIKKARISKATVGRFNHFTGPFELDVGENTEIGSFNKFTSIKSVQNSPFCHIGTSVHITNHHLFDASGGLSIGNSTRIAGMNSQFWTHGGQRSKSTLTIGERCYIGSAVKFAQGTSVADNSFVGLGSVVVDSFEERDVLISGFPAVIVKRGIVARRSLQ